MSWIYSFVNDRGCRKQDIIAFGNSHNEQDEKTIVPLFIFSKLSFCIDFIFKKCLSLSLIIEREGPFWKLG